MRSDEEQIAPLRGARVAHVTAHIGLEVLSWTVRSGAVRVTPPGADTTVYDIFDGEGRHDDTAALPFRVDRWVPPVVRGDTLWAVVTDEVDVQYAVRARLRPAGGAGTP